MASEKVTKILEDIKELSVMELFDLCNLCVRVCAEQAKKGLLGLVGRGFKTVIKPEFKDPACTGACKDCRLCAENCPTGALKIIG